MLKYINSIHTYKCVLIVQVEVTLSSVDNWSDSWIAGGSVEGAAGIDVSPFEILKAVHHNECMCNTINEARLGDSSFQEVVKDMSEDIRQLICTVS